MAHPLIAEFCRQAGELRPEFYRRCQRVFQHEVQPMLDERDRLIEENAAQGERIAALLAHNARLQAELAALSTPSAVAVVKSRRKTEVSAS